MTGTVTLNGGNLTITVGPGAIKAGDQFTIINNEGPNAVTGTFASITAPPGDNFTINYAGGTGNDVVVTSVTAVPEPSTWIGGALALAALAYTQRRRFARLLRKA